MKRNQPQSQSGLRYQNFQGEPVSIRRVDRPNAEIFPRSEGAPALREPHVVLPESPELLRENPVEAEHAAYLATLPAREEDQNSHLDRDLPPHRSGLLGLNAYGRTSILVMLALLLTKLTGQLRQILVGLKFGFNTPFADGFTQGFLVPDFIYTLLIGGAIQAAIVPYLSGAVETRREKEGWRAVSAFITAMALLMFGILLICELLLPVFMRPFASATSYPIAVRAGRALLPQAFFMMLAALLIGVLNTYKKFISTALTPAIYNVFLLLSLLLLGNRSEEGVVSTSWGITLGACGYFLIQLFLARRQIRFFKPRLGFADPEVHKLFRLALPTLISASIPYISSFLISSYYPQFGDGTSYAYSNASSTWMLPFGIIVVALANIMLPHLSEYCTRKDYEGASEFFGKSLRTALLLIVPAALGFALLSRDVIQGIFQWGRPIAGDSLTFTAGLLVFFCWVLVMNTCIYFLNSLFYSNQMTWVPMVCASAHLIFLAVACPLLLRYTELGARSMAAGVAVGSTGAVILLLVLRRWKLAQIPRQKMGHFLLVLLFCTLTAGLVLAAIQLLTNGWQPGNKLLQLGYLGCKLLLVYAIYFAGAWAMDLPEIASWIKKKSAA